MTNTELVSTLLGLFKSYMEFFLPVYGVLAGIYILIEWIYSFTFKPFRRS